MIAKLTLLNASIQWKDIIHNAVGKYELGAEEWIDAKYLKVTK
ncbi:hypothetical protein ABFG93_21490 (plasmid) [Pseudalkalibacillus hwajinpoensis]